MSYEQQKKEGKIMEILQVVTCSKCEAQYIASDGHECSEEANSEEDTTK